MSYMTEQLFCGLTLDELVTLKELLLQHCHFKFMPVNWIVMPARPLGTQLEGYMYIEEVPATLVIHEHGFTVSVEDLTIESCNEEPFTQIHALLMKTLK